MTNASCKSKHSGDKLEDKQVPMLPLKMSTQRLKKNVTAGLKLKNLT